MLFSGNACGKESFRLGYKYENNRKCEGNSSQISRI